MKTLEELIQNLHCRKGPAVNITKSGAYWLACEPIKIRRFGGDGVGQSNADRTNFLQLRHYRDGSVKAVIHYSSWHQNTGDRNEYRQVPINACTTIEEVVQILLGCSDDNGGHAYSPNSANLLSPLAAIGLPANLPAPDDEPATTTPENDQSIKP